MLTALGRLGALKGNSSSILSPSFSKGHRVSNLLVIISQPSALGCGVGSSVVLRELDSQELGQGAERIVLLGDQLHLHRVLLPNFEVESSHTELALLDRFSCGVIDARLLQQSVAIIPGPPSAWTTWFNALVRRELGRESLLRLGSKERSKENHDCGFHLLSIFVTFVDFKQLLMSLANTPQSRPTFVFELILEGF